MSLPNSITSIGEFAFGGDTNLSQISYAGIKADWSKIEIGSDNSNLTKMTIVCSDGVIAETGILYVSDTSLTNSGAGYYVGRGYLNGNQKALSFSSSMIDTTNNMLNLTLGGLYRIDSNSYDDNGIIISSTAMTPYTSATITESSMTVDSTTYTYATDMAVYQVFSSGAALQQYTLSEFLTYYTSSSGASFSFDADTNGVIQSIYYYGG